MKPFIRNIIMAASAKLFGNNRGKIVFYHDLYKDNKHYEHATPLALFQSHCAEAVRLGYRHVSGLPNDDMTYHICFDDGFHGIYELRDQLRELGICPTVYVAVDLIGKRGFLNKKEILELQAEGYDFQSHTWSHEYLPLYDDAGLKHELDDSRKWLSDFLQKDVSQICFPRGLFSKRIYEASLEAGYRTLISSIPGSINEGVLSNVLPRNLVQEYSPREYGLVLQGALSVFRNHYFKRHYK